MQQIISPFQLFVDPSGQPIENGSVYIGPINVNPAVSQIAVYWDEAGTIPAAQPLKVSGGLFVRNGTPTRVYFGANDYSMSLYDKKNSLVYYLPSVTSQATIYTDLSASTGAGLIGWIRNAVGAVFRWVSDKLSEWVTPQDFGAKGDGVTNDTAAFAAAILHCQTYGKCLEIPEAVYILTAGSINWAAAKFTVVGHGLPTLQYVGAGQGFVANATGIGPGYLKRFRVENLLILGSPTLTDGFALTGMVQTRVKNVEVRECTTNAFIIKDDVSGYYENLLHSNPYGTTKPTYGLRVTSAGTSYTADTTFVNCVSEDFPGIGCYMEKASGCIMIGGTFEGCATGMVVGPTSAHNKFDSVWFEVNSTKDIEEAGLGNSYHNCHFGSNSPSLPNVIVSTGQSTKFHGGYMRTAQLQATSRDTKFFGVGLDQNSGGSLGITGTGTYSTYGCTKIGNSFETVGNYNDKFGPVAHVRFAATQEQSSDPNTLDDYEEGTWPATLVCGTSGSIALTAGFDTGSYTKIGRLVTVTGILDVASVSSPVGTLSISGLPFQPLGTEAVRSAGSIFATGLAAGSVAPIMCRAITLTNVIGVSKFVAGNAAALAGDVVAGSQFYFSITYNTAS